MTLISEMLKEWEVDPSELHFYDVLGEGSTAEVFRSEWRGSEVAVKRLRPKQQNLELFHKERRAFEREVSILRCLKHKNLIELLGVSSSEDQQLIVTEFCLGGTCFDLLHETKTDLSAAQKIKMTMDIASGMEYLHNFQPQVIHRDLKSLNLLLADVLKPGSDPDWRSLPLVKISDFGLGRMKEGNQWQTLTKDVGTCHWMAPEILQQVEYDEKVDLYSYAMILFEIIYREIPFEGYPSHELVDAVMQGYRPDIQAPPENEPIKEDLLDRFRALMKVCWEQDPTQRPDFKKVSRWLNIIAQTAGCDARLQGRVTL